MAANGVFTVSGRSREPGMMEKQFKDGWYLGHLASRGGRYITGGGLKRGWYLSHLASRGGSYITGKGGGL